MFPPVPGEIWLRRSIRFYSLFTSENGDGASWLMNVAPSQEASASICSFPASIIYFGVTGRASFQLDDGQRFLLAPESALRVPANTRHFLKSESRGILTMLAVLDGNTGAENFLAALGETGDEQELLEEAKAHNVSLFLPEMGPEKTDPMMAAENRIQIPRNMGFCL